MTDVTPERFEEMVADALDSVPPDLATMMDNVVVIVDHDTPPGELFGLYEGVPLTQRGDYGHGEMPDRITIYRQTICAGRRDEADVAKQVRVTVIHEVGHHFGIDDARLHELGWA
ncbi:MAG TPA: metallopeptidase family protein [Acidimicrobiales bacterium]|nr:metallopeptidase family protein [Acidimicrobiales bacterium]